jgi:hypothetical protein
MLFMSRLLVALAAVALIACGPESSPAEGDGDSNEKGGHASHEPKHEGMVTVIGDHAAHIEVLHDLMDGIVTVYVYDAEMADLKPDAAPILNAVIDEGTVKLVGVEKDGAWEFRHEAFEGGHPTGRFLLKIGGKTYTPEFLHAH